MGAPRCGTTFLSTALRAHPRIFMPSYKEPHYFASDLDTGTDMEARFRVRDETRYLELFASADAAQIVGEASTSYLRSQVACQRIHKLMPEARFIASIRDPVEAIASTHARHRASGNEDLELAEAIDADGERMAGRRMPTRPPIFPRIPQYLAGARFGEQLERLFGTVPREQVLVLFLDDFAVDPRPELRRITQHLGLPALADPTNAYRNANRVPRSGRFLEAMWAPRTISLAKRIVPRPLHRTANRVASVAHRLNRRDAPRAPIALGLRDRLRDVLLPDLELASRLLGEDLVARW